MSQLVTKLDQLPDDASFDVVVIGAGGAGLSAAVFAGIDGASVLLVEHTEYVGGTTALSAGTTWVPGTHHSAKVNPGDTLDEAERYLTNAVGDRTPASLRRAFLDNGPKAVKLIEERTEVKYRPYAKHPDYISDLGGSTLKGRALEPVPFDGRLLGDLFKLIRPPIPEFTVLGGMMVDRTDINHLLALSKSWASFKHSVGIITRHLLDHLSHARGTRLVMGNALIARLLHSLAQQPKARLALKTSLKNLVIEGNAVKAVVLEQGGVRKTIKVNAGVVLSGGGFNRNAELRTQMLPGADMGWCPGAPGHTGTTQQLALQAGAQFGERSLSNSFWAPVSLRKRADGSTAVFPHFVMDRAKPGMITVNQTGERFVNESTSYHLFGLAMQEAHKKSASIPAYLICDAAALRKYGLGMVRPGGGKLAPFLADGYLTEGRTLAELAGKLGIPGANLARSVTTLNGYAKTGVDPDFQRGVTAYQQNIGDAAAGLPNPNIGPIETGPFYAVRLYPGDIGSCTGLVTNEKAQVLNSENVPIAGLYAAGNDMHSIMGGVYTAPGITIGPGLTFAFIACQHLKETRVNTSNER
jgi:succinate dehydrogenase/fumarate reductase flavoprotein subunit